MFNDLIHPIILGIVQGLGEFLPISSTAHLILVPYFFHWPDPGLSFDVALHFGTLIAVVAYFWREWITIFGLIFKNESQKSKLNQPAGGQSYGNNILWLIIIATIPGALAGYLLESKAETVFRSPLIIAFTLASFGLVLYLMDKYAKHGKDIKELTIKDAIIIGFSQAIAIIPGVSRSGATIASGLWRNLDRTSAARFSFLLSTPIIFGATILKLPGLLKSGIDLQIFLGVLFSAISGYFAIKYLLKFIEISGYRVFFWYRILIALIIIIAIFIF